MRVLVCGGRDFEDRYRVYAELDRIADTSKEHMLGKNQLLIIHGDCKTGADHFADEWFVLHCGFHDVLPFPADWDDISHPDAVVRTRRDGTKYDAKAGPRRNQKMIDEGKPDIVLAFPGGDGTADMVRRARKAGVKVIEIPR
jgi:hypothetical protein